MLGKLPALKGISNIPTCGEEGVLLSDLHATRRYRGWQMRRIWLPKKLIGLTGTQDQLQLTVLLIDKKHSDSVGHSPGDKREHSRFKKPAKKSPHVHRQDRHTEPHSQSPGLAQRQEALQRHPESTSERFPASGLLLPVVETGVSSALDAV